MFCIIEFFGGFFTQSVAILSDAVHDLGDSIAIGCAYFMEKVSEKKAEAVADNAVMLERIKTKLLQKLDRMVDAYPDTDAAEVKHRTKTTEVVYRMKDIAAVYTALEDKTVKANVEIEDLSPLVELLRDE